MNLFIFHYLYFLSLNIIITSQFFIKLIYLTNIFDLSVESFVETNPIIKLSLLVKKKGNYQIFGKKFNALPDNITVNGSVKNLTNKKIYISSNDYPIILEWNNNNKIFDCSYMFAGLSNIISIDLSEFNLENITSMSCMFFNNYDLKYIKFGEYSTLFLKNMSYMFANCISLTSVNLSIYSLHNIDMSYTFYNCTSLVDINFSKNNKLYLNKVIYMFYFCSNLISLDLESFDTSNITSMYRIFKGCVKLNKLININFDISKVTLMAEAFTGLHSLTSLDLTNLISSNNTINMKDMFSNCYNLQYLNFSKSSILKSNNMKNMFNKCSNLISLDLTNFDTSLVTNMNNMFHLCVSLKSINFNSFNTSSVRDMGEMFKCCHSLTSLNLSNFDVNQVTNFIKIFEHCNRLEYIDIYKFKESLIYLGSANMFYRTTKDVKYCLNEENSEINNYTRSNCSFNCYSNKDIYYFVIDNYTNCYEKCLNYYYFDIQTNKYYCTNERKCPNGYKNKSDTDDKQCIKTCDINSKNQFEFKKECFSECPNNTEISKTNPYYCNVKCPKEYPF